MSERDKATDKLTKSQKKKKRWSLVLPNRWSTSTSGETPLLASGASPTDTPRSPRSESASVSESVSGGGDAPETHPVPEPLPPAVLVPRRTRFEEEVLSILDAQQAHLEKLAAAVDRLTQPQQVPPPTAPVTSSCCALV